MNNWKNIETAKWKYLTILVILMISVVYVLFFKNRFVLENRIKLVGKIFAWQLFSMKEKKTKTKKKREKTPTLIKVDFSLSFQSR